MSYSCLFDLDGTVYRGQSPIEGAVNFINRLKKNNIKYKFITNRSDRSSEEVSAHLNRMGIISTPGSVITSAMGVAAHTKGRRVYVLGSDNLRDCIRGSEAIITGDQPEDVVIGFDGKINFDDIRDVCQKIFLGARFLATNPDVWIQSELGIVPENGSILAVITSITKIQPIIIGKPNSPMIEIAFSDPDIKRDSAIIIGDNLDTDIAAANSIGLRSILLLTGVTNSKTAEASVIKASWIAKDYKALEAILFS
ncbi:MAG: HAD-IIA family hydrolase [Alphaproteobacteria bacterium]|nr:HAD-IIA family hydrolase [Alphaproteobacteria bacterium]MDG1888162.1 HAD-IIA family hydrolase [Alphaproteobacteria bacterium]